MGAIFPKRIHVKPTLRGLVVTDHRKNPPERVGEVVPYRAVKPQGGFWSPVTEGGNPSIFCISPDRMQRAASRMYTRAIWNGFLRGELSPECEFSATELRAIRFRVWLIVAGTAAFLVLAVIALITGWSIFVSAPPNASFWDRARTAVAPLYFAMYFAVAGTVAVSPALGTDPYVRFSRDVVVVRRHDGREERLTWKQLVRARPGFAGQIYEFEGTERVCPVPSAHMRVIFERVRDPVAAKERKDRSRRRMSIAAVALGSVPVALNSVFPQMFAHTTAYALHLFFAVFAGIGVLVWFSPTLFKYPNMGERWLYRQFDRWQRRRSQRNADEYDSSKR